MAYYKGSATNTATVVNGDGTINFAGTTNMIANARIGEEWRGPDGRHYEIIDIVTATQIEVYPNYEGTSGTFQNWFVAPVQGYYRDAASRLAAAEEDLQTWLNLPVADLLVPQWRTDSTPDAWAMRTVAQLLLDGFNEIAQATVASAATVDLGALTSLFSDITVGGVTIITSFGNNQNCFRIVRYAGAMQVNNGANLLTLTGANRSITAGSWGAWRSDATGPPPVWREVFHSAKA